MAKKLKDYYDLEFATALAEKIKPYSDCFDAENFMQLVTPSLEQLEFNHRQVLMATALKESIGLNYSASIAVFYKILGPELQGGLGMFTEGYWLWPIGKYVELFGAQEFEVSSAFSKELTKRFTGEFCMRPLIQANPEKAMQLLLSWSQDPNLRVRRLASECIRIRLPWAKKLTIALEYFDIYLALLANLKDDTDKSIQKSVANNLNDLYKEAPEKFDTIIASWSSGDVSPACQWVIKHASRTKNKNDVQ